MIVCCAVGGPAWKKVGEIFAWIIPSAVLMLVPKCPACLAGHMVLWTGLGLSLSTATYLRWVVLLLCVASLLFLIAKRLNRIRAVNRYFKKETEQCHTK